MMGFYRCVIRVLVAAAAAAVLDHGAGGGGGGGGGLLSLLGLGGAGVGVGVRAQSSVPSCASQLVPCQPYMNATSRPPESCCSPLREAVTNELPCLCAIFDNPAIRSAFGIDPQKSLQLAAYCGVDSSKSQCPPAGAPAPSANNPPPATPGGGNSAGHRMNGMGMIGLMSFFLFWWSILA